MTLIEFEVHLYTPDSWNGSLWVPLPVFLGRVFGSQGEKPENCLQKINSVGLTEWKFPPASVLRGALRKCFCQFCFTATKCHCFELWFHGNLGSLKPQDGAVSWTISENSSEEFSLNVRALFILWLARAFDSKLWTMNFVQIFLLPPPTYWSSTAVLLSLCFWRKSVWRKRQHGLTEKAQVWCQTDLHGSTTYQLRNPWAGCSLSLSLGIWNQ